MFDEIFGGNIHRNICFPRVIFNNINYPEKFISDIKELKKEK